MNNNAGIDRQAWRQERAASAVAKGLHHVFMFRFNDLKKRGDYI